MMNEIVIHLSRTYKAHGEETSCMTLREIKCKDMRKHQKLFSGKDAGIPETLNLILDLSGWTQSALDELSMKDVMTVMEVFGGFLEGMGVGEAAATPSL